MRLPRGSGLLLHPTSLPGRFGIGDFGPEAEAFLDLLVKTGQRWWQILPLGPTGYGSSPYQSHSSFAGNPLLISPDLLVEDGLLLPEDLGDYPNLPEDLVDFDAVAVAKAALLDRAYRRFGQGDRGFGGFLQKEAHWLDDYSLYMALKEVHGGHAWNEWEPEVAHRRPEALADARMRLKDRIREIQFVQYQFDRQWRRLRESCREKGIGLIGDLPIFVAHDSSDVWARPDLFELDEYGRSTVVAGVPPDFFSEDGQLWGNPLYRWDRHEAEGFSWWASRLKGTTDRVDIVRLDHFRGFEDYWEVPAGAPTAASGRWMPGPRGAFLSAMREALGGLPLIAEDLGLISPEVEALRDEFRLPGMKILQFAFGNDPMAEKYLPHAYPHHCLVYTGTHDNDTTVGWFTSEEVASTQSFTEITEERDFVRRYVGTDGHEIHWDLIRLALASVADTAIVPLQDVLGLGEQARMNTPGVGVGNWGWRLRAGHFHEATRRRLAEMTAIYGRWNGVEPPGHRPAPRPR